MAEEPAPDGSEPVVIDVHARDADAPRSQIGSGATTYTFNPAALGTVPQGSSAPLNDVLLRAPGVAEDSFGQIPPSRRTRQRSVPV